MIRDRVEVVATAFFQPHSPSRIATDGSRLALVHAAYQVCETIDTIRRHLRGDFKIAALGDQPHQPITQTDPCGNFMQVFHEASPPFRFGFTHTGVVPNKELDGFIPKQRVLRLTSNKTSNPPREIRPWRVDSSRIKIK